MPYKIRTRQCATCGQPITGRYPPAKPVRCIDCAVKVLETNSLQMLNHAGAGYDRWLESAGPRGRPRKIS